MKVRTQDIDDAALDWAVAICTGYDRGWLERQLTNPNPATRAIPAFGTDWNAGGALIDRFDIEIQRRSDPVDTHAALGDSQIYGVGPTKLKAAMRCVVALCLGPVVDVSAQLLVTSQRQVDKADQSEPPERSQAPLSCP